MNSTNNSGLGGIFDTPDYTANTTYEDIQSNKVLAVLAYFGILFLVPYLAGKTSKYAQFHANQGFVLFLTQIAYGIVSRVIVTIFSLIHLGLLGGIVSLLLGACVFVLWLLGVINSASGKSKELPIVGQFRILK